MNTVFEEVISYIQTIVEHELSVQVTLVHSVKLSALTILMC